MSLQSEKKSANAVGAKTARACDSCLRRRARWYCAADDAFLCQGCDSSVHSANPLARRHERLRLKTASSSSSVPKPPDADIIMPSWHQGFKRKARTPRPHHHTKPTTLAAPSAAAGKTEPLVPDLETASFEETLEEEQLIYRVPVFYPVLAEFYTARTDSREEGFMSEDLKPAVQFQEFAATEVTAEIGGLPGFLPSDIDFAADVESLLGCGLDEDSFCMEGLGLLESRESPEAGCCLEGGGGQVKEEMDEEELAAGIALCHVDPEMELSRETLDLNFDCGTPTTGEDGHEEEEKVAAGAEMVNGYYGEVAAGRRRIALRLDYEGVIAAWSTQGSPWADGERPQFNPDDCWPDYLGMWGCGDQMGVVYGGGGGGEMAGFGGGQVIGVGGGGDSGGREARVSRYREKRRTRLFSKKIRYEVRKLNAEKRPRMKGRFVKRVTSSFAGSGVAVAPLGVGSSSFTYR